MNFHNITQGSYLRTVTSLGVRQQLQSRGVFDLPGGLILWKAVGRIVLSMLPFILAANMFLASTVDDVERSLIAIDNQRHELMDKNIGLLAKRARLYAPERVSLMAADKLSLYAASPGQIERIN
ncbi:MAG: hypothetical protein KJ630_23235 [Proteobacteria bacterium]|nr:hypothetical protein [Pseudomonadota bacterium]